jgi:hypothetical protein
MGADICFPSMGIKQWFRGEESPWGMSVEEATRATTGDMSGADPRSRKYEEAMRVLEWERHRRDQRWLKLAALAAGVTAIATTIIAVLAA